MNLLILLDTKPLLKWAGGKRQLLKIIEKHMPLHFDHYFEPFFGGGALYFHLYEMGLISGGTVGDTNRDLMDFYRFLKTDCEKLLDEIHQLEYGNNQEDFLHARKEYNDIGETPRKSALLIYLNKHCFNGLYRVNLKGEFNVPFGKYRTVNYPSDEAFRSVSESLKNCTLITGDYKKVCERAIEKDFVYFDPPYYPLSETASFTSYTRGGFDKINQEELAKVYRELDAKGIQLMESNSDSPLITDLYCDYRRIQLNTRTNINSIGTGRNAGRELIILNY